MPIDTLLEKLRNRPETVRFDEVISVIDNGYVFTPTAFRNGAVSNAAGENNGSCKILAFASLHALTEEQALNCFGDYYRRDVLGSPEGDSHRNIRNFMVTGWGGVEFDTDPSAVLVARED